MSRIHISGGIFFHYIAWRFGHRYWRPFKKGVEKWLDEWKPRSKHLLIIGASGGYCLPRNFLLRFESVTCMDPDPLAKGIFKRRYRHVNVHWVAEEAFLKNGRPEPSQVMAIYNRFPNHAILFCNCVGQWPLMYKIGDPDLKNFVSEVQRVFPEWASFHDIYSADLKRKPRYLPDVPKDIKTSDSSLKNWWLQVGGEEIRDHMTSHLFVQPVSKKVVGWQLTPRSVNLIEFVNN